MSHLMRRIAIMGVSAAVVGGALLATEGSASASTLSHSGPPRATVAVANTDARYSPWIADQLAFFVNGNGTYLRHHEHFAATASSTVSADGRSGSNGAAGPVGVHVK
jgi:hypothetical protein